MSIFSLDPDLQGFRTREINLVEGQFVLTVCPTRRCGRCPLCKRRSASVHSHYCRSLADLPISGCPVRLRVCVRRFFCRRRRCRRKVFAERLGELALVYAHRTQRLSVSQQQIGLALGGNAGAKLAAKQGQKTSASTLLRLVRRVPSVSPAPQDPLAPDDSPTCEPVPEPVRVLGVDDWAFRKGHRYGTILVDLQRHRVVDLLPDRSAESLAEWLKDHPGVEIISRDRAQAYAQGARDGAPDAQQVADRWHLLRNLGEAMERLTAQHTTDLRQVAQQRVQTARETEATDASTEATVSTEQTGVPRAEQRRFARCAQREARYHQIKTLRQQGWSVHAIVAEVGVSKRTVQRFLRAEQFPARSRRRRQPRNTDPYEAYLRHRVQQGCHNAAQLYREVKQQGYAGGYINIYKALQSLLPTLPIGAERKARSSSPLAVEVPSSRSVAWWLQGHFSSRPDMATEQKAFVQQLCMHAPILQEAAELAQAFIRMVQDRSASELDPWLQKARQSACLEMRLFAEGLYLDLAAIRNAMTLSWSNGQTEGQVNRLKFLKRQMYGRAALPLLRRRVLLA